MAIDLSQVPAKPGVYLFKASGDRIIYVGKAKNLKNRLRSYFQGSSKLDVRKASMVGEIKDFSYIVTGNELEAWILEANLIKQYKPKFNIVLRDDKNYPYLKVTVTEEWPRVEVVRKIAKDGNLYFGPYIPAQAMWEAPGATASPEGATEAHHEMLSPLQGSPARRAYLPHGLRHGLHSSAATRQALPQRPAA